MASLAERQRLSVAGLQHTGQPVERGVGIAVAHGLVQRGDQVVMLFARLVIEQDALLQCVFDDLLGDLAALACRGRGNLEHVVGRTRVTARVGGNLGKNLIGDSQPHLAQAALCVFERTAQQNYDLRFSELVEDIDAAAREQSTVDFEGRILGGGADQADVATLDVREKGVLLGAVETVDLVDK
jgi:hypothetical protein